MLGATVAAAEPLGSLFPFIGAPAFALILGMTLRLRYTPDRSACGVLAFASSAVLKCAVVLLGATFGLAQIGHIGRSSLPLMLGTLAIALVAAWLVGRALGVSPNLQTLVGVGTAICGASAIGAVSGVIGAAESEIAYAISTIFVFNVVAVVLTRPSATCSRSASTPSASGPGPRSTTRRQSSRRHTPTATPPVMSPS